VSLVAVSTSHPLLERPSQLANPLLHDPIVQLPVVQLADALGTLQGFPHVPQFARELSCCSHPSVAAPLQLPQPPSHAPSWQAPPKHWAEPCAKPQTVVQVPQCWRSAPRSVSHPFDASLSQLPHPGLQAMAHVPALQVAVPWAAPHALAHAPQWLAFVLVFVSHPLPVLPSQFPQPAAQTWMAQEPVEQVTVAFARLQVAPHVPQFAVVVMLVSHPFFWSASQLSKPVWQTGTQRPPTQLVVPLPFVQATPQAPQFATVPRLTSHPLAALASQSLHPVLHVMAHTPCTHWATPLVSSHFAVHAPQLAGLSRRLASQPFALLPSQLSNPDLHEKPQSPDEHVATALA